MATSLPPEPPGQGANDLFADDPFFHPGGAAQPPPRFKLSSIAQSKRTVAPQEFTAEERLLSTIVGGNKSVPERSIQTTPIPSDSINSLGSEFGSPLAAMRAVENAFEQATQELGRMRAQSANLESDLDSARAQIVWEAQQRKDLEEAIEQTTQELSRMKSRSVELDAELIAIRGQSIKDDQLRKDAEKAVEQTSQELSQTRTLSAKLEADLTAARAQITKDAQLRKESEQASERTLQELSRVRAYSIELESRLNVVGKQLSESNRARQEVENSPVTKQQIDKAVLIWLKSRCAELEPGTSVQENDSFRPSLREPPRIPIAQDLKPERSIMLPLMSSILTGLVVAGLAFMIGRSCGEHRQPEAVAPARCAGVDHSEEFIPPVKPVVGTEPLETNEQAGIGLTSAMPDVVEAVIPPPEVGVRTAPPAAEKQEVIDPTLVAEKIVPTKDDATLPIKVDHGVLPRDGEFAGVLMQDLPFLPGWSIPGSQACAVAVSVPCANTGMVKTVTAESDTTEVPIPKAERKPLPADAPVLTGTFYSPQNPVAIINGMSLKEGEMVATYELVRILPKSVTLRRNGEEIVLEIK